MKNQIFDDYEREVIRHFADKFNNGESTTSREGFPRATEVGLDRVEKVLRRFVNFGLLYWEQSNRWIALRIDGSILDLAHNLENPPPRDYWKDVETWFRGRWWSVPLVALVVLLPILAQWLEWFWSVVQWAVGK